MSDNEDPNARRAARPSTPPFRGPTGPAGRPPLAPPASGQGGAPGAPPGQSGGKPGSGAPFALPPAGPRRPATPAQGARRPAVTPPRLQAAPRSSTPSEADLAAIPAYGAAPPPSVAATLKSISEFTIVEEPAAAPAATPEQGGASAYEPPTLTARVGDVDASSDEDRDKRGSDDAAPAGDGATDALATLANAAGEVPYAPSLADTVEWRATPSDLDAMVTVPPLEADRGTADELTPTRLLAVGVEANDDVIAAAFDAGPTSMFADSQSVAPEEALTSEEPELIGGSASSRFAAECLEDIARAIRAGEIAAPAMHPEADHAAVLAAVLATLLAPRA